MKCDNCGKPQPWFAPLGTDGTIKALEPWPFDWCPWCVNETILDGDTGGKWMPEANIGAMKPADEVKEAE